MTRPRDTQRQRVYDAESGAGLHRNVSKAAARILDTEARLIPQQYHGTISRNGKVYSPSIEDCQKYIDDLVRAAWFQRRFGRVSIVARWKAGGRATGGGSVALPPWSRNEGVILHEVAHVLTERFIPDECAWHGREFAAMLLLLVKHRMGAEKARAVREAMRKERVRVAPSTVLPKPTREVVTQADLAARRAAKRARRPSNSELLEAAEIIRQAVASGVLGPSGRKPREHASATARALEGAVAVGASAGPRRVYHGTPKAWR